jgi:integrase
MPQYQRKVRQGIRWWYKFSYEGLTYHSKAIYLTKNEAKRAENDRYKEIEQQAQNPSHKPDLSLLDAINERLDYVEIKKSKHYYKDNKRYYTKLVDHFGDVSIRDISKRSIQDFLLETSKNLQNDKKDNYSVNAMLNVYKALFNYVIDNHELEMRNPCSKIEPFPVDKKLKYIPTDKDIEAIKNICDEEQELLINFVMETGARINEPLRITGKDITNEFVILYTRKSKNSNLVPRKLPLPECIKEKEIALLPDKRLFDRWIEKPKFLERKVKLLNQRPWNWHNLRHRRASLWNKEGKSLYEIMSLLGHSNLKTTQGYLQLLS